jgi:hypothetical protein
MVRAAARTAVVAGTATAVAGGVAHHQQQKYANQAEADAYEQQMQAPPPPAPVAPMPEAVPMESAAEQLTQLAALHEQGVLTDAEFEAEKAKVLAG